jgi:hypothetical protein
MELNENIKYIVATAGIILFGAAYYLYAYQDAILTYLFPIPPQTVHVHADFALYIHEEHIRFTDDRYQSSAESVKHPDMHFHDNIDTVVHRHAEGITLAEFFAAMNVTLTDTCLTLDDGVSYCEDTQNVLHLYVNGTSVDTLPQYIVQEKDQLLLYYGQFDQERIDNYLQTVTDESCIYSGTCPERGTPPPESCGLTCDV